MSASKARLFVTGVVVVFLLPLAIPNVGLDWPYLFVLVIALLAWFMIKWTRVTEITQRSGNAEVILGLFAIGGLYAYKLFRSAPVGILDLLILFLAIVIIFYGFKSLPVFWIPVAYGIILLSGYQIEQITPDYTSLQNWLASVMASSLNAFGIGASASGHLVSMNLPNGSSELLNVEGACTGLQGILAFGMLSTMALLGSKPRRSRLVPLFVIGFLGAFLINIGRLLVVFLTFEFFGVDAGITMHVYFGYLVFLAWVLVFWALAFKYLVPRQSVIDQEAELSTRFGDRVT